MKKALIIALICIITLCEVLILGVKIVFANEKEQTNEVQQANTEQQEMEEGNLQEPVISLEQSVEKFYNVSEDQVLLQQKVVVNREKNQKLEKEDIEVVSPMIQEKNAQIVTILVNGNRLEDNSYQYDAQTGILTLSIANEEQLSYINQEQDVYQFIFGYLNMEPLEAQTIDLAVHINTKYENFDQIATNKEDSLEISAPLGQSISLEGKISSEIAKGYMYQGNQIDTEFAEEYKIEVSNLQGFDQIVIYNAEENYTYMYNEQTIVNNAEGNTYFMDTYIAKEDMLKFLGEDGKITIKDVNGVILAEVNKDTETDESGRMHIAYPEKNIQKIQIELTKPIQEGSLAIRHKKAMKAETGFENRDLQRFTAYEEKIVANEMETVLKMNLTEPTLQADFQVSKTDLSTMQSNQELEMKLILKSAKNDAKLYNHPFIRITMPEEIETINLQDGVNLLYEDEMQVANAWIEGKTICIQLTGEQTIYKEQAVQGAEINFKVNVTLNKKATNENKEIIAQVTNENDTVEMKAPINIVSPKDMIAINKVETMGIEAYGEENSLEASLQRHADAKQIEIKSEIINNKENVNNVKILGKIPTNTTENNLNANMVTPISVEGAEATIYYTENENADENLEKAENGWTEDMQSITQPKKYLLAINQMNQSEVIHTSYAISVPSNLEYNQQATEGYSVFYTSSETNINNTVKATDVTLTTGKGPILETELSANVGNDVISSGDIVKVGEVVQYTVKVKNTGTEEASNVTISGQVPEGMILLEQKPAKTEGEGSGTPIEDRGYVYGEGLYNELQTETFTSTIDTIGIGETKEVPILLKVMEVMPNIHVKAQIQYEEDVKETNEISITPQENALEVYIKSIDDPAKIYQNGLTTKYAIGIKNHSDEAQNHITVNVNLPEYTHLIRAYIGENEFNIEENLVIDTIQPQEEIEMVIMFAIDEFGKDITEIPTSVILVDATQNETRSNVFYREVYNTEMELDLTATNEGGYVKTDDIIEYKIQLINTGKTEIGSLVIEDKIPNELTILEVTVNGENIEFEENNHIAEYMGLAQGETKEMIIKTIVNYSDTRTEDIDVVNKVQVLLNGEVYKEAQASHTIEASRTNIDPNDPNNPNNPNNPNYPQNGYTIRGYAWVDQNEDGRMQDTEDRFSNMNVMLLNVETNALVTDESGNYLRATTGNSGEYMFTDLSSGKYMVIFEYDTSRYSLSPYQKNDVNESQNSDVISRSMNIAGTEKTYAVTDTLEITDRSIANISIGLIELDEADLQMDKFVKRIITQNSDGTNVITYNADSNLGRVELDARKASTTNLVIEYEIRVTNVGEVEAYARNLMDSLPDGLTFNSELNKDWYQSGDSLYNIALSNEKIGIGESKSVTLTLTKRMSEDMTGTYTNRAAIVESYTESGIVDHNKANDTNSADVIISIRTGAIVGYTALILSTIVMIGTGIYFIKKKVLDVNM